MITLNYIVRDDGRFLGYIEFNNNTIFSSGDSMYILDKNMKQQLYTKYKIVGLGKDAFNPNKIKDADFPYDKMNIKTYTKLKREAEAKARRKKFIGRVAAPELPKFTAPVANKKAVKYEIKDGKLIIYQVVAEYDIED